MTKKETIFASLAICTIVLSFAIGFLAIQALLAKITLAAQEQGSVVEGRYQTADLFVATSTNATSSPISIAGAKKVTLIFSANSTSTDYGTREFHVQVSDVKNANTDTLQTGTAVGNEFTRFNKLISNITNSNSQQLTRVSTVTLTLNIAFATATPATASNSATTTLAMDLTSDMFTRLSCSSIMTASTSEDVYGTCRAIIAY